jgi:hypothetical protein
VKVYREVDSADGETVARIVAEITAWKPRQRLSLQALLAREELKARPPSCAFRYAVSASCQAAILVVAYFSLPH